jgi:hypothetical protein
MGGCCAPERVSVLHAQRVARRVRRRHERRVHGGPERRRQRHVLGVRDHDRADDDGERVDVQRRADDWRGGWDERDAERVEHIERVELNRSCHWGHVNARGDDGRGRHLRASAGR